MSNKLTIERLRRMLRGKSLTNRERRFFNNTLSRYLRAENGIEATMGGLTDKGFNYNGAWGGPSMAMGGGIPGTVGFTYARTQSPAPSNGPYAKKTKPSAQNGQEMKYYQEGLDWRPKTISKNGGWLEKYQDGGQKIKLPEEIKYFQEYASSPMYKERLMKMAGTERALQTIPGKTYFSELFSDSKLTEPLSNVAGKVAADTKENIRDISEKIYVGDFDLGRGVAGGYDSGTDDIRLRKDYFSKYPTTGIHEISHSSLGGADPFTTQFREKYLNPILKSAGSPGWEPYVQQPGEIKARLDTIRFLAKKKGLYDAGKEKFTEEHLKKLQKDPDIKKDYNYQQLMDQLKKGYEKSGLIWMMNNIAKLEEADSQDMPLAQSGTVIEDPMGQWAYPGEITRIPSNEITMQGVDYPVLGISDTGDTQMMQPGQDYTFDGNSVTEIPMMQKGGDVDPGYSEPDYVTGTSRRTLNKMIGMGNYLIPGSVLNQAADLAKAKGLDYGATTSGPADAVRHASASASTAARIPVPKIISDYSPALDRAIRIGGANVLGLGYELANFNPEGFLMDIKNNYRGSLVGSIPGLTDKERNKMIVNQLTNKQLTVDNPKKKKENGGWLNKYE